MVALLIVITLYMRISTKIRTKKSLSHEVASLQREIKTLRSVVIGIVGQDKEGHYQPKLVKEVLEASTILAPHIYSGHGSLLGQLAKYD